MRTIDPSLAMHLDCDATTLCHAWRVMRRDGVVLGFTEHDHDLAFADTSFTAASGFSASATEEEAGLPEATSDVAGGFSSDAITEDDLQRGAYDGARVEVFLVNWSVPAQHLLIKVQEIGEVVRDAGQFRAELRSFAHRLNQPQGRVYGRRCDAALGDGRCGVDLAQPQFRAEGIVVLVRDESHIQVSGIGSLGDGFFRFGELAFLDGVAEGQGGIAESYSETEGEVTLWLPLTVLPEIGDRVRLTAGCDKAFATCRTKFSNQLNFQGFPHIPGADFAYTYADDETVHDGSALFK
ncbi:MULTISPECIES: DUF2163 domain-containing protein [unclassified Rhizobium]|uniref:DUF2163 domain-containing protein n=1 Tax=unclassified Rhizobium TaxID=2613769 RepID=UPI0016184D68|nr:MULTISPECIES: DUF2163 domain-containing protein [unclassified Rhizobium]MBB3539740.1 putative phage protein (TIGR02218 family) [Rhizobium sp. BK399]MCS3739252.1 putative phage protein (TIGR02218 family) [Rhizobium sp. BK661]MCS4090423.1 putative phage protein (TIGR02218 family) [Rhizobium sp. BK176]